MHNRTLTPAKELVAALLQTPFRPHRCVVNGQELKLMRLEIPIEVDDFLEWLDAQTLFPKIYWENPKENMQVAAIGSALELDSIPQISSEGGPRFFGGQDFTTRRHQTWGDFPSCKYILPLIEIEQREESAFLCINRTTETLSFDLEYEEKFSEILHPISRLDSPSFAVWERHIREILGLISQGVLSKVVPARCTRYEFEKRINPYSILKKLQGKSPAATLFAFQFDHEKAFIGASPETLYRREGKTVKSAAIAGTRRRGSTQEEDQELIQELLNNSKEVREFTIVKKAIQKGLAPLCTELRTQDGRVIQTSTVQHIHHTFEGTLKDNVSDEDLIKALHPTPAVGGLPKNSAIQEIQKREHFDRGWYAAPLGWITHQKAHHLVGIRSALIEKNKLRLFAGAGIVKGSIPLNEWDELEQKISQYILWNTL